MNKDQKFVLKVEPVTLGKAVTVGDFDEIVAVMREWFSQMNVRKVTILPLIEFDPTEKKENSLDQASFP